MAKLKKKPIIVSSNIKVENHDGLLTVAGPKGSLSITLPQSIEPVISVQELSLKLKSSESDISLLGLYHSLVENAVNGVLKGWQKTLEMTGVGFRAQTDGSKITLNVGFTHPVEITAPQGVSFKLVENKIIVEGTDKYLVGETAAKIRRVKPPEPYKGKGIKYIDEKVRKKAGKAAKAVGAAVGKA